MRVLRPAPSAAAPPLFLFPPVTGETECYVDVAAQIDDRAVYALEARTDLASAEAIAGAYLDEILETTDAPLVLAGWSAGGIFAYEAARQAVAVGRTVAGLALVEVRAPVDVMVDPVPGTEIAEVVTIAPLVARLAFLAEENHPRYRKDELAAMTPDERIAVVRGEAIRTGFLRADVDDTVVRRLIATFRVLGRATMTYRPAAYTGRLTLFEATSALADHPRPPTLGWEAHAPDRTSIPIDGNVFTVLHPRRRAGFGRALAAWTRVC